MTVEIKLDMWNDDFLKYLFTIYTFKIRESGEINFLDNHDEIFSESNFAELIKKRFTDIDLDFNDSIDRAFIETAGYHMIQKSTSYKLTKNKFVSNLQYEYGQAFYFFETLYVVGCEVGNFVKKNFKINPYYLTLLKIHSRACSLYAEINTLIQNGFPNGAMARFRSLQESAIIFEFILKNGEFSAEAYMDYIVVAEMKEEKDLKEIYAENYVKNATIIKLYEENKKRFEEKYGEDFTDLKLKNDYIWAMPYFEQKKGNKFGIKKIKEEVKRKTGDEQYKLASNIIHSAPKSLVSNLGNLDGTSTAGGSNIGLENAASWTAYEFLQINTGLLNKLLQNNSDEGLLGVELLFIMKTLSYIVSNIYESFEEVSENIITRHKEELKL